MKIQIGNEPIADIKAREILDSNGRPMVEEAFVLRDGGRRFDGLGVRQAVKNVIEIISPALIGRNVYDQQTLDHLMIELDGTPDKSHLGANAIYSVSIAVARAAANSLRLPLYRYLGGDGAHRLPVPIFNMINGGPYSGTEVEFQEFSFIPSTSENYYEALRMGVEVLSQLGKMIEKHYGKKNLRQGYSGGYAAPVNKPAEILEILSETAETIGYGKKFVFHLDCAASHFHNRDNDWYNFQGKKTIRDEMINYYEDLVKCYPILMVEDPLDEDDFEGHKKLTERLNIFVAGDDLFVTNMERLKKGISIGAANAMIFKPNMIGTLSESLDTASYAKEHGYIIVPSSRAGGSVDDPIPDIAVAIGAQFVKFGAPKTGERVTYQNRLLRIEEELGTSARFHTIGVLRREFNRRV